MNKSAALINIKTILIAFLVLGISYSIVTPIFEASDERAFAKLRRTLQTWFGLEQR